MAFMVPSFIVLERGSNTARMRWPVAHLAAQAVDGGADGGGVVGEVVVDLDAADLAAQFQPAAHVLERGQRLARGLGVHAHVFGRGDGRQRVELVVLAEQGPVDAGDLQAAAQHVEGMRFAAGAQRAGRFLAGAEPHAPRSSSRAPARAAAVPRAR